jgi:hypothetical protein
MMNGIKGECAQWTKMVRRRRYAFASLLMALSILVSASTPARADDRVRIEGTFSVFYAYPSAVNYCVNGAGDDNASIQAQGLGNIPGLGGLFFSVTKCFTFSEGTYAGTFAMSADNGDVIHGTYEGTQGAYDKNGFSPFWGVLTITGGTGRFENAKGRLRFEATSGPDSKGAIRQTLNGMAFYRVRGTIVLSGDR